MRRRGQSRRGGEDEPDEGTRISLTRGEDEDGPGEEKLAEEDAHSKRATAGEEEEKGGREIRAD